MVFRETGYRFPGSCSSPVSISSARACRKIKSKPRGHAGKSKLPGLHPSPGSAKCGGRVASQRHVRPEMSVRRCCVHDVAFMTEMAMKAGLGEQLRREPAVATALAIFVLSTATLA